MDSIKSLFFSTSLKLFALKLSKEQPAKSLQYHISPIFILLFSTFKTHKCIHFLLLQLINKPNPKFTGVIRTFFCCMEKTAFVEMRANIEKAIRFKANY